MNLDHYFSFSVQRYQMRTDTKETRETTVTVTQVLTTIFSAITFWPIIFLLICHQLLITQIYYFYVYFSKICSFFLQLDKLNCSNFKAIKVFSLC